MSKDTEFLCQPQRLTILKGISAGKNSATSLAEHMSMSLAHISQQLKLMEAYGIIRRVKYKAKKVGKPKVKYEICKDFIFLTIISPHTVVNQTLKAGQLNQFMIHTAIHHSQEDQYFWLKFFFLHEDIILPSDMIAVIENKTTSIDLFMITNKVDIIRKKFSNITLKNIEGKEKKFVIWSHTTKEVEEGLQKHEKYFVDKLKNATIVWDKHQDTLAKLKNILNQ